MKSGFVSIFGRPNAGKSTLLNAVIGEPLAIVSPKVQTTRHRIKGILSDEHRQIIFSDTPGIMEPKYKLHERMMGAVRSALEDADLALLLTDIGENREEVDAIFSALRLRSPALLCINKTEKTGQAKREEAAAFFSSRPYCREVHFISALTGKGVPELVARITELLPEGEPFYAGDDLSDLPTKFFVSELIRGRIYELMQDEIPYQTAVLVNEFKEKSTLIKISADIIVQRESQKAILLGEGGKSIRRIGTEARGEIEAFLQSKVFLELFVKVRPKWRENDNLLREYGY